jgi:endo-1,4-beta-xylanase
MGIRPAVFPLLSLCGAVLFAAETGLDSFIAKHRMGTLVIRTTPGAKVSVEQIRHEFWFGATLPGSIFTGQASPEDIANFKEIFTANFNAGVIEANF